MTFGGPDDYRWIWTVIVVLIWGYALFSLARVYWREWKERRRARRASGDMTSTGTSASDTDPDPPR